MENHVKRIYEQPGPADGYRLLVKADSARDELIDSLCGQGETFRAEAIAEEIEASLGFEEWIESAVG